LRHAVNIEHRTPNPLFSVPLVAFVCFCDIACVRTRLHQAVKEEIPLECGLRLKPGFADNSIFLKDG